MTSRRLAKFGALLTVAVLAAFWFAADASAHVTVAAPGVTVGASDATITFRAPDESATASTVGLKVQLPVNTPMAGVLVVPMPGWTVQTHQTKLSTAIHTDDGDITEVVSEVDWTAAAGAGIKPGYIGQFTINAGKLPDKTASLTFKAIQTYSDGKVVSWNQVPAPGDKTEPDFPAPTLDLAASTGASAASASPAAGAAATTSGTHGASKAAATTGIVLGAVGLVLGAVALGLVLVRGRRRPVAPPQ